VNPTPFTVFFVDRRLLPFPGRAAFAFFKLKIPKVLSKNTDVIYA
jgi:hypothetical protein